MIDIDQRLMEFKLFLRELAKPGKNEIETLPASFWEYPDVKFMSRGLNNFTFYIPIATYQHQEISMTFETFDDYGEFEFKLKSGPEVR